MQQWDYKVERWPSDVDLGEQEWALMRLGDAGWELTSILSFPEAPYAFFFFKRPREA